MSTLAAGSTNISATQLVSSWIARLSDALYRMSGAVPTVRRLGQLRNNPNAEDLWWQCDVAGASTAVLIGADDTSWRALAGISQNLDVSLDDEKAVYLKLLGDSFGTTGTQVDRQPQAKVCELVEIRFPGKEPIRLQFLADSKATPGSGFGSLLNIELPISVRFGATQMLLQDLMNINAGSTVEFDRRINDPVEILVNGRVLARGEAVLVKGNYGVRIVEIADRQERLETSASSTQRSAEWTTTTEEIIG